MTKQNHYIPKHQNIGNKKATPRWLYIKYTEGEKNLDISCKFRLFWMWCFRQALCTFFKKVLCVYKTNYQCWWLQQGLPFP